MNNQVKRRLEFVDGAFGPKGKVPLLGNLVGSKLLSLVIIGYSSYKDVISGVVQNDGKYFPHSETNSSHLCDFCREVCEMPIGMARCMGCDCQAIAKVGGVPEPKEEYIKEAIREFNIEEAHIIEVEKIYFYWCHTGLLELIRAVGLLMRDGSDITVPIAAIWSGQHKIDGYVKPREEIERLAQEIGHNDPDRLVQLYQKIKPKTIDNVRECAKTLVEIATAIETTATGAFHYEKQIEFEELNGRLLNILRPPINTIKFGSEGAIERQLTDGPTLALRKLGKQIPGCYSALIACDTKDSSRVKVIAHGGEIGSKLGYTYTIRDPDGDFTDICAHINKANEPKLVSPCNDRWTLLGRFIKTVQINDVVRIVMTRIESMNGQLLFVQLMSAGCVVLTPSQEVLPEFRRLLKEVAENIGQTSSMLMLVEGLREAIHNLEEQRRELLNQRSKVRLLIQNLSHQVSRPILELKQAARRMIEKPTKQSQERFEKCMAELQMGSRHFDTYQAMISHVEQNKGPLYDAEYVDLQELVEKAHETIKPFLIVDKRQLYIKWPPTDVTLPKIWGSLDAFYEVLVNVLHNAIKYSIGTETVELEVSYAVASGVKLRIVNCGIEIEENDYEKIFDVGYRAESAQKVSIEGAGLGLYISRELVKMYEGNLQLESVVPVKLKDGKDAWRLTFVIEFVRGKYR